MPWGKSKPPPRRPHPDPAKELELQRILDLRASIGRRSDMIGQYRREIGKLYSASRGAGYEHDAKRYERQADKLHERITEIEAAIAQTGEDIAALTAKMNPDDLAFL